jgi:holin-like protein
MLVAITVLLVYQLIGEIAVIAFGLPVPGPVVGMALLFVSLIVRGSPRDLVDVATLIKKLDVETVLAQSEVRVFKLTNTMARDLSTTINAAIRGQPTTTGGAMSMPEAASRVAVRT